jgi:hypothetical protein
MSAAAADFSAAEFVKTLTDEQKEAVFLALAEEGVAAGPEPFAVPLTKGGGPVFGYLLSAAEYDALQREYRFPHADADDYEAKRVPRAERNWLTVEESLQLLDEEDVEPDPELPLPSTGGRTAADR